MGYKSWKKKGKRVTNLWQSTGPIHRVNLGHCSSPSKGADQGQEQTAGPEDRTPLLSEETEHNYLSILIAFTGLFSCIPFNIIFDYTLTHGNNYFQS